MMDAKDTKDDKIRERLEVQKRFLHRVVLGMLERGKAEGLKAEEVQTLTDGLLILGWVPHDVKIQRAEAEKTDSRHWRTGPHPG